MLCRLSSFIDLKKTQKWEEKEIKNKTHFLKNATIPRHIREYLGHNCSFPTFLEAIMALRCSKVSKDVGMNQHLFVPMSQHSHAGTGRLDMRRSCTWPSSHQGELCEASNRNIMRRLPPTASFARFIQSCSKLLDFCHHQLEYLKECHSFCITV